jgi:DNA-binding transcriptional ArsR family regulator
VCPVTLPNRPSGELFRPNFRRLPGLRNFAFGVIVKRMLNQETAIDQLFHALAVPVRRSMVERLSLGPASVTELAKPLAISLPAVVQHLEVLETSGLVRSEKKGRVRICRIEPSGLLRTENWIAMRRSNWEHCLDRLAKHLGEED